MPGTKKMKTYNVEGLRNNIDFVSAIVDAVNERAAKKKFKARFPSGQKPTAIKANLIP